MFRYLLTLSASFAVATCSIIPSRLAVQDNGQHIFDADYKVPVELGVMSRCPDALLCENVFDHVLQSVPDKVDLTLRYIAMYIVARDFVVLL